MRKVQLFSAIEQLEQMGFYIIDIIAIAGIVKPLAEAAQAFDRSALTRLLEFSAQTSVRENGAKATAIIAHAGCRGNSVPEAVQKLHLRYAEETISSFRLQVPNYLFWQKEDNTLDPV